MCFGSKPKQESDVGPGPRPFPPYHTEKQSDEPHYEYNPGLVQAVYVDPGAQGKEGQHHHVGLGHHHGGDGDGAGAGGNSGGGGGS